MFSSRRKKSLRHKSGRQGSLWKQRRTTIIYLLWFTAGLLAGSVAAVLCSTESIPYKILENRLVTMKEISFLPLWQERLLFMAILLVYLMVAERCLWGNGMIPAAPFFFGIGQGTVTTMLLVLLGFGGMGLILLGVIVPRTVQLAAIILLCNLAQNNCAVLGSTSEKNGKRQGWIWLSGTILLASGTFLETMLKLKLAANI